MNLAGVLSAAPFNGRAAFSFNEFFSALPSAFTVLSTDSDYLFFGSAFSVGSKNFPIVLSDGADAKNVIRATRGESGLAVSLSPIAAPPPKSTGFRSPQFLLTCHFLMRLPRL